MASRRAAVPAKHLFSGFRASLAKPTTLSRSLATTTEPPSVSPNATLAQTYIDADLASAPTAPILKDSNVASAIPNQPLDTPHSRGTSRPHFAPPPPNPFLRTCTTTLHAFPTLEPLSSLAYPSTHLLVPLRRDILHRAIIYEGDATRQGTASQKWRSEVHGSNRKIRPQKGTGSARLGNKKSPMLKGGGKAFGPKPRDFSTGLNRKVYDLAWRIALSYRFKMGQLLVVEDGQVGGLEIPGEVGQFSREGFVRDLLRWHDWGNAGGRTLFIAKERREGLFAALEEKDMGRHARALTVGEVDVKDLLELGRVVIEKGALEKIFSMHEGDLRDVERLVHFRRGYGAFASEMASLGSQKLAVL